MAKILPFQTTNGLSHQRLKFYQFLFSCILTHLVNLSLYWIAFVSIPLLPLIGLRHNHWFNTKFRIHEDSQEMLCSQPSLLLLNNTIDNTVHWPGVALGGEGVSSRVCRYLHYVGAFYCKRQDWRQFCSW